MNQAATFGSTRPIIPAGTQLNGIYEIDEPIAAGGMGEIYKGHAIQTGDIVAIKLIRSDLSEAEAAFALFRKEASALHNLYHEAIVRYYVFTVDPTLERPYLAMEYVDGQSLSAMLRGGPLAFDAVHRLTQRIAAGLNAAHERGIIHRDVSPDNIIIPGGDMGRAKIIDFGIARSTRLEDEGTVIGAGFAGKYNYVSPEQLGLFGGDITPKSDIYSLGLVLAEALRGEAIDMGGNHVEVIEKRRAVPDLGPIDARMRPLIEQMLQPNPEDRPASMAEVAAYRADAPPQARPRPVAAPAPPRTKPRGGPTIAFSRVTAAVAGLAVVAVVAVGPSVYHALRPPPAAPAPAPVLQSESAQPQAEDEPRDSPNPPPAPPKPDGPAVRPGLAPMNLARLEPAALEPTQDDGADAARRAEQQALAVILGKTLARYDGGECFFAKPVILSDGAAAIEGFGLSTAPFRRLDDALSRLPGRPQPFGVDIGVRQVSAAQCPAISFLNDLRGTSAPAVKLDLAGSRVAPGEAASGSVAAGEGRDVGVLVIGEDGIAYLATTSRASRDEPTTFTARMGEGPDAGKSRLLLAISAPRPLTSLKIGGAGVPAAKLFPQILAEAERGGLSLAAAARTLDVEK